MARIDLSGSLTRAMLEPYVSYDYKAGILYWNAERPSDGMTARTQKHWISMFAGKPITGNPNNRKTIKINGVSLHAARVVAALHYGEVPANAVIENISGDVSDYSLENQRLHIPPAHKEDACNDVSKSQDLTREMFERHLDYNPSTGDLTWRIDRPSDGMDGLTYKRWLARYGGKVAGTINSAHSGISYITVYVRGKPYRAHRIAMAIAHGEMPHHLQVDHLNGNGLDNRLANMRFASASQNSRNRRMRSDNPSGYTGVFWHAKTKKWRAVGTLRGKNKHIGLYERIEDAAAARDEWQFSAGGYTDRHGK